MTDYERGTPAWDIGMVLTRHGNGTIKTTHNDFAVCARVISLRQTANGRHLASARLRAALDTPCSCGAGNSPSEESSLAIATKMEGRDVSGSEPDPVTAG